MLHEVRRSGGEPHESVPMVMEAASPREGRLYFGWIIVLVSFLTMTVTFGASFAFSVFFVALLEAFGWSRAATASAYSLHMLVAGLASPVIGVLMEKIGPRKALPLGAFFLAFGLLGSGLISNLWQLYLFYGIIAAVGVGFLGLVPHSAILSNWFVKSRGTAIGIAFSGMGVGIFLFSPFSQYLISAFGWRVAFFTLAALVTVILIPLNAFCQRGRPEEVGLLPEGVHDLPSPLTVEEETEWTLAQALRSRPFWFILMALIFTPMSIFPVLTHQVAYLVDLGYRKSFAVTIFALVGILSAPGRVLFGSLSDRMGRVKAATLSYLSSALGVLALLFGEASWLLYLYAILFGLGFGARGPILSAMAADIFQGKNYSRIYGLIILGNSVGMALGPWWGGLVYDLVGNYTLAFWGAILAAALACLSVWLANPQRKIDLGLRISDGGSRHLPFTKSEIDHPQSGGWNG